MADLNSMEKHILKQIANIETVPIGAYNIRENGKGILRQTTANIDIITKTNKPGIEFLIFMLPSVK